MAKWNTSIELPADPVAPMEAATKQYVDNHAGSGGITVHFPFFLADGAASNIALTADQKLPFLLADGTRADITLTT